MLYELRLKPKFPTAQLTNYLDVVRSAASFSTVAWNIHGFHLECSTDDPWLEALINQSLRFFQRAGSNRPPDIRLVLTSQHEWGFPDHAEILPPSSNEQVDIQQVYGLSPTFARSDTLNYFELAPLAGAVYEFSTASALAYIHSGTTIRPTVIRNLFLQTILLELLRAVRLYWVHAACVAEAGRAVLLVGPTGSGKTTTGLNLVESGFQFLSQDRTLIRLGTPPLLLGFPEDLAVTQKTLALFPNLGRRLGPLPAVRGKHQIDPGVLWPESLAATAQPALILFPHLTGADRSSMQPVSPVQALQRLLPNSLLASRPEIARLHFEALARLVEASKAFELHLGSDIESIPALVRRCLTT